MLILDVILGAGGFALAGYLIFDMVYQYFTTPTWNPMTAFRNSLHDMIVILTALVGALSLFAQKAAHVAESGVDFVGSLLGYPGLAEKIYAAVPPADVSIAMVAVVALLAFEHQKKGAGA